MTPQPSPVPAPLPIGWKERLDFPEWGLKRVRVKIDTGARTSALGVAACEIVEIPGRGKVARLRLVLNRRRPGRVRVVETPVLDTVVVSNSAGAREERPLVEAEVRIGPVRKRIRLTITNRAAMRFPMILGREALAGDFIVDVSRQNLLAP
jgi:hypothetical protein